MSDVYNTLGKSGTGVSGNELLGSLNNLTSRNSKKVLEKLIGKEGTKKLMRQIQTQKRFREVDTKVRQGSETAPRQAAVESMKRRNQEFNIEDLKQASVTSKALQKVVDMLPSKYGKLGAPELNELVDLMTKPGGTPEAIARMKMHGFNEFEIGELLQAITAAGIALPPAAGPQEATPTPVPSMPMGLMQ